MTTHSPNMSGNGPEMGRFWNKHPGEREAMERQIVHLAVDAFAITVERLVEARLRQRPVVVANPTLPRAVVQAASSEAQQAGIHRGMLVQQARRLCRDLTVIPPNEPLYSRAMQAIIKLLGQFSPLVEPVQYGRLYLDLTGTTRLFGSPHDAAVKIQREFQSRLQLPTSLGVASNKLVSNMASQVTRPSGIQEVQPGAEPHFISPLPVGFLPVVHQAVKSQLLELNLRLIKHIAALSLQHLTIVFGRTGLKLYQASHAVDPTPVFPPQQLPNIYEQLTLAEDTNDLHLLRGALYQLVEKVGDRLRHSSQAAQRMLLEIYYSDHREAMGQKKLPQATNLDQQLFAVAEQLLTTILTRRIRVRRLAVRYFQLTPAARQISLFDNPVHDKNQHLIRAIDHIRQKFGAESLKLALAK
ncbi:MAG: hypothetical protein ONB16_10265 [candidate division KSB1 bacterium]|nr:hypothetical protein [candidate division KSB1 bacterium]MDZ7341752.1 hypothetical protein [candidate division KSB1 bacterium]